MKNSFMYVPAVLIGVFLLNSFVLKGKVAGEKTTAGTKSIKDPGSENKSLIDASE